MTNSLSGIYAITDTKYTPYENIKDYLIPLFEGGVKILQFRDKFLNNKEYKKQAIKIQKICKQYSVLFIINDRYQIALEINANGVHIGKDDMNYNQLVKFRKSFNGIIGVSCYGDIHKALEYEKLCVDYVAFGSMFSSHTKPNAKQISHKIIKQAKKTLNIPICVIGGITEQNISSISKYKPDMLAIISDIYKSKNIKEKLRILIKLINN